MFQGLSLIKSEFIYFWSIYVPGFDLFFLENSNLFTFVPDFKAYSVKILKYIIYFNLKLL